MFFLVMRSREKFLVIDHKNKKLARHALLCRRLGARRKLWCFFSAASSYPLRAHIHDTVCTQ